MECKILKAHSSTVQLPFAWFIVRIFTNRQSFLPPNYQEKYVGLSKENHARDQGFPQVLRTWWGALQNLMGGGGDLSQYMGGMGGLKMPSKIPVKEFIW